MVTPPTSATCSVGPGRMLDYMVVGRGMEDLLEDVKVDLDGKWKTHIGYIIQFKDKPHKVKVDKLVKPSKIEQDSGGCWGTFGFDSRWRTAETLRSVWSATECRIGAGYEDDKELVVESSLKKDWIGMQGNWDGAGTLGSELVEWSSRLEHCFQEVTGVKVGKRARIPCTKEYEVRTVGKESKKGVHRSRWVDITAKITARLEEWMMLHKQGDEQRSGSQLAMVDRKLQELGWRASESGLWVGQSACFGFAV